MDDIFGPDPTETPEATAPSSTNNLEEFDDIFGNTTAAEDGGASSEQAKGPSVGLAAAGGSGTDEFDDIFGDSKPVDAAVERLPDETSRQTEAAASSSTTAEEDSAPGSGAAVAAAADTSAAGGDKEFLDFLYEDDAEKKPIAISPAAPEAPPAGAGAEPTPAPVEPTGARYSLGSGSPDSTSPLGEEGSFLEIPTIASPSAQMESGSVLSPASVLGSAPVLGSPLNPHPAPAAVEAAAAISEAKPNSPVPATPALQTFVRKEKVEVLRPLPADPAAALRELTAPEVQATTAADDDSREEGAATATTTESAAADDVNYVRRLCAATGGFLPTDLRPVVWSLLLGRGKKPVDAGFVKWRAQRRETSASTADTAAVAYKLDLRNDGLALARRLCDDNTGENGGAGAVGSARDDPEALALDIEEVLTFYCTRRSEAYEPVLCALVGPLFSMGLEPPAVSALLNPLAGSLTLFLGRGLTHAVRDLAWAHAHRRLHDLCTYHDPELVQHLNRSFPGWEMPLPAASVSRAETTALDQEAAAMVDDLESSLAAFVPRRRASMAGSVAQAEAVKGSGSGTRPARADGQGLVEPSLLVAANAGLGASAPLGRLLPLWDYLLVRHDKHFGFFLLLAVLLRRREELLLATGPELRLLLAETLSPSAMATLLVDQENNGDAAKTTTTTTNATLVLWCKEAEALDLATPESFRHHLALIGEIAEAEYEAAVRARARKDPEGGRAGVTGAAVAATVPSGSKEGGGAPDNGSVEVGPPHTAEAAAGQAATAAVAAAAEAKGTSRPSLLRMRTMIKTAGDKLAADLKNLKLARSTSDSRHTSEELAAPTELSLPQLCLAVSAKELVTGVSGKGRGRSDGGDKAEGGGGAGSKAVDDEEAKGELFRERQALAFFAVDCRPKQQVDAGRFPTAYHLDPSAMDNPEDMAETIMPVFEPLRKRAHVCLVGSGDGHLRARGLGTRNGKQGIGSQKAARDEYSYVNTCALFFVKRGFPYVSVLEGGFAAAHELVMDTIDGRGGEESGDAALSTAIVDHNPAACRLCLAQKPGGNSSSSTDGVGGVVGGMRFPLSPPLWARIGAADASAHGPAADNTKESTQKGDKERVSPFFPTKSPETEKASSSNHSSASAKSGGGEGGVVGAEDGEGSGHSSGAAPAAAAGSNIFKGGAMFSGMKMNMSGIFNKSAASSVPGEGAGNEKSDGVSTADAAEQPEADAGKGDTATDLAAKLRTSFGKFGSSKEIKKDAGGGVDGAAAAAASAAVAAGSAEKEDSGFGSLFRKAQSFKAADVAAAFADLRDGPKLPGATAKAAASSKPAGGAAGRTQQVVEVEEVLGDDDDDDDDAGELFVIGDDGSEASETPDSDFEGFDGEHRPPSAGGVRTAADKEVALLEHRLSGQIKGATMVVDDFLKVPGAKVFNVTKHKVTFHDVDAAPEPPSSENATSPDEPETDEADNATTNAAEASGENESSANLTGVAEDSEANGSEGGAVGDKEASPPPPPPPPRDEVKRMRVRAVTELDRVVFLSRERILVLACPSGPSSPGLVKSNHHLTELQKMTFMRRDPSLVTLHYLAPGRLEEEEEEEGGGGSSAPPAATKRNVYRFDLDDKEAFIRIIRGALQRFQA